MKRGKPVGKARREAALATRMGRLHARMRAGESITSKQMTALDAWLERVGPGEAERAVALVSEPMPQAPGEPDDVRCSSYRQLAVMCGLHYNTITNWKNAGIEPTDDSPYSLKGYFLLLRRRQRLGECKPTDRRAYDLWRWCFGAESEAVNPDDPTHGAPTGWGEERERQQALGMLQERRKKQIEVETLEGERIPADLVRNRLRALVDEVRAALTGFLSVPAKIDGLTPEQRANLADVVQAQITVTQAELGKLRERV